MLNSNLKKSVALWASTLVGVIGLNAFVASSALASGFGAGNGGDPDAARFMDIGVGFERYLQSHPAELPDSIQTQISTRIYTLTLEFAENVDNVPCAGTQKVACNFPETNRIVVARRKWHRMQTESSWSDQNRLVIHELLGLAGSSDAGYATSGRLVESYLTEQANQAEQIDISTAVLLAFDPPHTREVMIGGKVYTAFLGEVRVGSRTRRHTDWLGFRRELRSCRREGLARAEVDAISQCSRFRNPAGCHVVMRGESGRIGLCSRLAIAVDLTEHLLN